jgi:hypothetical protein
MSHVVCVDVVAVPAAARWVTTKRWTGATREAESQHKERVARTGITEGEESEGQTSNDVKHLPKNLPNPVDSRWVCDIIQKQAEIFDFGPFCDSNFEVFTKCSLLPVTRDGGPQVFSSHVPVTRD